MPHDRPVPRPFMVKMTKTLTRPMERTMVIMLSRNEDKTITVSDTKVSMKLLPQKGMIVFPDGYIPGALVKLRGINLTLTDNGPVMTADSSLVIGKYKTKLPPTLDVMKSKEFEAPTEDKPGVKKTLMEVATTLAAGIAGHALMN